MTSFLAWLAADRSRKSCLYFASDSRLSFTNGTYRDDCQKLFTPSNSPDIFAMLGLDVAFPKWALPAICTKLDEQLIPPGLATSMYGRIDWVLEELRAMKSSRPGGGDFTIFHASRNGYDARCEFALTRHQYDSENDHWHRIDFELEQKQSHALLFDGTGGLIVQNSVTPLTHRVGDVSRVHFEGFCKALSSATPDPFSGGPPQLLSLGSAGFGRYYGIKTSAGTFYKGLPALFSSVPPHTQWRNECLQAVGPNGPLIKNRRRKLIKGKARPPKGT